MYRNFEIVTIVTKATRLYQLDGVLIISVSSVLEFAQEIYKNT